MGRNLTCVVLAALHAPAALGCGYCVEDKIASTYDHFVVTRALGQKHNVAFLHIDGPAVTGNAMRRFLETSAESTAGVDRGSVRVSLESVTISLAFDPGRTSLPHLLNAMDRKLAARGLSLMPLRVMDRLAELKPVGSAVSTPEARAVATPVAGALQVKARR